MSITGKKEALALFVGDIIVFLLSLSAMLLLRYQDIAFRKDIFWSHFVSFSILFVVWIFIYFISGLYEKHTIILKSKLPAILFNTQIANTIIAVLFFYFIPFFGITPKTNLFVYLIISFVLMLIWRLRGTELLGFKRKQNAMLIGGGEEMRELLEEVNNNNRYELNFISSLDLEKLDSLDFQEEILNRIYSENVSVIAVDLRNEKVSPILPSLYNLIFSNVNFIDMYKIYEDIFDKVPLSLVKYSWFLENISLSPKNLYDILKRAMDLLIGTIMFLVSLIFYPFVFVLIKAFDGGEFIYSQERIGKNNQIFRVYKFKSMKTGNDGKKYVTKIGKLLRKTRIDELPQLWNVVVGNLSLIGPRPEMPDLVNVYEGEIPYYNIRHLIKPGLSGWAQLYQKAPPKFEAHLGETRNKLSYDLYYIKNRSLILDIKIALKTLKTLISTSGK